MTQGAQGVIVFNVFLQLLLSEFFVLCTNDFKSLLLSNDKQDSSSISKSVLSVAPYKIAISYPYFKTAINYRVILIYHADAQRCLFHPISLSYSPLAFPR